LVLSIGKNFASNALEKSSHVLMASRPA
jgi:hypothetical protein